MNLQRFLDAQSAVTGGYGQALDEMRRGRKTGHWIWYIFPVISGWSSSYNHVRYGLEGLEEAVEYLSHPTLGSRLREITNVILSYPEGSNPDVFMMWNTDARKLLACMTLFDHISPDDIFGQVCEKFFAGARCSRTLSLLADA